MSKGKWLEAPQVKERGRDDLKELQATIAELQARMANMMEKNEVEHDQANLEKVKAVLEEIKLPSDLIEEVLSIVSKGKKKVRVFDLGGAFVYLDKDTGHYDVSTDYNLASQNHKKGSTIKPVPAVYRNNILYGIIRDD